MSSVPVGTGTSAPVAPVLTKTAGSTAPAPIETFTGAASSVKSALGMAVCAVVAAFALML